LTRKIRKHAAAERDLVGRWRYTFERWGKARADRYLDELDDAIQQLAATPEMGAERDDVRDGYRVVFVNSHAVYYTARPSAIHIIRVLHGQMDPYRHL